jgi:hypothetical protein
MEIGLLDAIDKAKKSLLQLEEPVLSSWPIQEKIE